MDLKAQDRDFKVEEHLQIIHWSSTGNFGNEVNLVRKELVGWVLGTDIRFRWTRAERM